MFDDIGYLLWTSRVMKDKLNLFVHLKLKTVLNTELRLLEINTFAEVQIGEDHNTCTTPRTNPFSGEGFCN